MDNLFSFQNSTLVIIFGACEFPESPNYTSAESFRNSAEGVVNYFLDQNFFGLPQSNLLNLFDSELPGSELMKIMVNFLSDRLNSSENNVKDIIVYYVGHGDFSRQGTDYFLAIRRSIDRLEEFSSLSISAIARILREYARHIRKFLILDCCFAASAYQAFQSSNPLEVVRQQTMDHFAQKGTCLLCASGPKVPAKAPEGQKYTMFSGVLLETLRNGLENDSAWLSFSLLADGIEQRLKELYPDNWVRPQILSPGQNFGLIAKNPIFPNPKHFQKNYKIYYTKGIEQYNSEKYEEAINSFKLSVKSNPQFLGSWNNLGVSYKSINQFEKAVSAFEMALKIDNDYYDGWHNLSKVLMNLGRFDEAIEAAKNALKLNPFPQREWVLLGDAYRRSNKLQDAIESYVKAVDLSFDDHYAWYNLGFCYLRFNSIKKAINAFEESIKQNPDLKIGWESLVYQYYKTGQIEKSIEVCERALLVRPKFIDPLIQLSNYFLDDNNIDDSLAMLTRAKSASSENFRVWYGFGLYFNKIGRLNEALENLTLAMRIDPKNSDVLNEIGVVYGRLKKTEESIAFFKWAIETAPDNYNAYFNLGVALNLHGEPEDAIVALLAGTELRPKYFECWYALGIIYEKNLNFNEAIVSFKKALEITPDHNRAKLHLYECLKKSKEIKKVIFTSLDEKKWQVFIKKKGK